jgi:hypothetical protein
MRARNVIANSTAIVASVSLDIQPRVTPASINREIEHAIVEYKDDEELRKWLDAIDDATSDGAGKYAGATWMAASRLMKLVKDNTGYPALNSAGVTIQRVRKGIYGPVLRALKMHRVQRFAVYERMQALAATDAAKAAADDAAE